MAAPTVNVTANVFDQGGNPVSGALLTVTLDRPEPTSIGYVTPKVQTFTADANGIAIMSLWPNALGTISSSYRVKAKDPTTGKTLFNVTATVPNSNTQLSLIADQPSYPGKSQGQLAIDAAVAAIAPAVAAQTAAAASASTASTAATNAATSEANAATSAANAAASQAAASASQAAAATSETNAATSETNAATSAANAATSEANAATSEANAAASAISASTSAAAVSAANISAAETNAANSAAAAATSATNAATSATNASTSEINAATSETNAATSETNAATSAANTATSEANAATSAANAATSEANAAASAASINPADIVHITGAETVTGQKTFTAPLATADPTAALGLATKQMVDAKLPQTSTTGSAVIPSGTTAQRDTVPAFGYTRANSTSGVLEWWDGAAWSPLGGGGGYTWTVKTAAYTAVDNDGILADTTTAAFTVTLPATPTDGMKVMVMDGTSAGSWGTNNLTVARNGATINGAAADYVAVVDKGWVEFIYDGVNANTWVTRADYASGTREVTQLSKSPGNVFSILRGGKLYNAHANAASWWHPTGRTTHTGNEVKFGVQDALIQVPFPETVDIIQTGSTGINSFALFSNGNLYTWGGNTYGVLGLGDTAYHWMPQLSATGVTEVFDAQHYGMYWEYIRYFIRKADGTIWGAGANNFGALGDGTTVNKSSWTQITALGTNTTKLFNMGGYTGCTFALKSDGTIWACGYNGYGNLGDGTLVSKSVFTDVTAAWGGTCSDIMQMGGGYSYSVGATIDNRCNTAMLRKDLLSTVAMYTCGNSTWGARGDGTTVNTATVPYLIPNSNTFVEMAAFGGNVTSYYARTTAGDLVVWGHNTYGQLGTGSTAQQNTPITVVTGNCAKLFNDGNDAYTHGYYMQGFYKSTNGDLMGTGWNTYGELGVGDVTQRTTFTRVLMPNDAGEVVDLGFFTSTGSTKNYVAKTTSGKLFCWGYGGQQNISMHTQNVIVPSTVVLPQ